MGKSNEIDRLGVFCYSHEENTHAFNFNDDVSESIKQERAEQIMDAQVNISFQLNQEKIEGYFVFLSIELKVILSEEQNLILRMLTMKYSLKKRRYLFAHWRIFNVKIIRADYFDLLEK